MILGFYTYVDTQSTNELNIFRATRRDIIFRMRKLIKISLVAISILFLIFASVIYLFAFGFSTKEYKNDFISFSYPAVYSLTMENTINSHELRNGKDLYGTTNLRFENSFGIWVNMDSLRVDSIGDEWNSLLKDKQRLFNSEYKKISDDSFEVFTGTTVPGYKQKLTFFRGEKNDDLITFSRSGSIEVGFLGKAITILNIPWSPSNILLAKFYELQALHFADVFESSFVEVE